MDYFKNLIEYSTKRFSVLAKIIGNLPHLDFYLFLLSTVLIVSIKFFQFPSLTTHAEMFAENGTNFFIHAYRDTLLQNLLTTDAGYLPLTQRLIALLLVKGFHLVSLYPFVSQCIAVVIIAIFSSLINFNLFKNLHSSTAIRFILGIAIGLISDYELNAFINFIYYGAILLFFAIFIDKQRLSSMKLALLTFCSSLIFLSKGQFIVFLPVYLFAALLHYRKKQIKSLLYYLITIIAGIIQLIVMYYHSQSVGVGNKIVLLFYYVIKTVYYFVLTYRHVFFGYVTKDKASLFGIAIIFTLVFLGVKKIFQTHDRSLLYMFLVGNVIALSSLFLSVSLQDSNVNPFVKSLVANIGHSTNVVSITKNITQTAYKEGQNNMSIFDVKHFANLRSLFFSNLLIFLTGILVILKIFSKNSQKVVILLLFCFTSGAFAQIKGEENYPNFKLSYSQWSIYDSILSNKQYCIPINHYPFLLHQNCDYLLSRDPENMLSTDKPVDRISLSHITPFARDWKVSAVILINNPNQFSDPNRYSLSAYDKNGKSIGIAKQLVPNDYAYIYYLFDKEVIAPDSFMLKDKKNNNIKAIPNIIILGTNKTSTVKGIVY